MQHGEERTCHRPDQATSHCQVLDAPLDDGCYSDDGATNLGIFSLGSGNDLEFCLVDRQRIRVDRSLYGVVEFSCGSDREREREWGSLFDFLLPAEQARLAVVGRGRPTQRWCSREGRSPNGNWRAWAVMLLTFCFCVSPRLEPGTGGTGGRGQHTWS